LKLFVKLLLSFAVNTANSLLIIAVIMFAKFSTQWDRLVNVIVYIVFFSLTGLTLLVLFLIHRRKPLEEKTHIIIYWIFSFLCLLTHLMFYLTHF